MKKMRRLLRWPIGIFPNPPHEDAMRPFLLTLAALTLISQLAMAQSQADPDAQYQIMDPVDVKLNALRVLGRKVQISGWIGMSDDYWIMYTQRNGLSLFYVGTMILPHEEMRNLLLSCSDRCYVTIKGRVGLVDDDKFGVSADSAEISTDPAARIPWWHW